MTFETFLTMFLSLLVSLAETMTAFCNSIKRRLEASPVASNVKSMAPTVETPPAPPPEKQGGIAPSLPTGVTVDLSPVYIPRVPGASDANGRITPVKCDLSGATGVDAKGESYTIVGLASGDAKNRLVCRHGKRAVLRFTSDLTIAGATATTAPAPVNTPAVKLVDSKPAVTPQPSALDKRIATLFDALVATGLPKTIASLQARSMAEQEALDNAKSTTTVQPTKVETVDSTSQSSGKAGQAMYPQSVPSGATRVVFYNADGTPMMNTAKAHHSFAVDPARCATPGSPAYKWVQGTHRLAVAVGTGKARCEYH